MFEYALDPIAGQLPAGEYLCLFLGADGDTGWPIVKIIGGPADGSFHRLRGDAREFEPLTYRHLVIDEDFTALSGPVEAPA